MTQSTLKDPPEHKPHFLWRFFSSVKLTLALLIILAVTSVAGTVIPQQESALEFARELGPTTFKVFMTLSLFDMYHSTWFRLLLGLLGINLLVCSIDRFPGAWRRFRKQPQPDRDRPFQQLPEHQTFQVAGGFEDTAASVEGFLSHRFKNLASLRKIGQACYAVSRGKYSHFGVYLIHLSVFLILVGGLIGSFLGFQGFVNIVEGETIDHIAVKNRRETMPLGFEVRCDRFFVDFYPNRTPKEYRSDLVFLVEGQVVEEHVIRVNHPVEFRGMTFYQSSYGSIPGSKARVGVVPGMDSNSSSSVELEKGRPQPLPGGEGTFSLRDANANMMGMMGPAALIVVEPTDGDAVQFWIFQEHKALQERFPGFFEQNPRLNPASFAPYTFFLENLENRYYTGLQVNRDPGVPIVWTGFFMIVAGFYMAFFMSHRQLWVRVEETPNGTRVSVAGHTNKNPVGLERELNRLSNDLSNIFTKGA